MEDILIGTTDRTILVFIPDSAQTDGSGATGLDSSDLTVSYTRVETDNDVVVTDVTSSLSDLSALTDAHTDWGLKEVSNTLAPGLYRLDIADAVFATGAWYAVVYVMVTTSAASPVPKQFNLVAALNDLSAAQVNAEVVDALATDTYAEPGQGAPAATTTLAAKINYIYKSWRNKKDNDGTTTQLYADDESTVDQKQSTSSAGGTVTKGEWVTGP
jgi:hypothetical protein